jgi:nucleoside-diphosphate-sugar epimerase
MELMARSYHYTYWDELPAIGITRCANVFGYGDTNERRVIPLFVNNAACGRPIHLKYRRSGRQFIHVTDAVSGYILAASSLDGHGLRQVDCDRPDTRSPFTPTFHFSIEDYPDTNEPFIRMDHLAKEVASIFPVAIDDSGCIDFPKNENKVQALNCVRTRSVLNWGVAKTLKQGVADLGEWYKAATDAAETLRMLETDLDTILLTLKGKVSNSHDTPEGRLHDKC